MISFLGASIANYCRTTPTIRWVGSFWLILGPACVLIADGYRDHHDLAYVRNTELLREDLLEFGDEAYRFWIESIALLGVSPGARGVWVFHTLFIRRVDYVCQW